MANKRKLKKQLEEADINSESERLQKEMDELEQHLKLAEDSLTNLLPNMAASITQEASSVRKDINDFVKAILKTTTQQRRQSKALTRICWSQAKKGERQVFW